jgi:predicted transcriptional regulator
MGEGDKPMDGSPELDLLNKRDLAWEAGMIAEAEADAGLLIPSAEVGAWIDSLGTDSPLPMPQAPKRSA